MSSELGSQTSNVENDVYTKQEAPLVFNAPNGVIIFSDAQKESGVKLFPGATSWDITSDVNLKRNIREVNYLDLLNKLETLKIYQWSCISQSADNEHVGPVAQEFFEVFGLGKSTTSINTIDPDGIALATIREVYKLLKELNISVDIRLDNIDASLIDVDAEISDIHADISTLTTNLGTLSTSVSALGTNLATVTTAVNTHTSQLASITTTVGTHTSQLASLTATVGTLTTQVASLNTQVANISTILSGLNLGGGGGGLL